MQAGAETGLEGARAELLRDRETFERQVGSVLEKLTMERLQLAEQSRRLLARRSHLVLVGRRLRQRWHGERTLAKQIQDKREAALNSWEQRLEVESAKLQQERLAFQIAADRLTAQKADAAEERRQLEGEIQALRNQRTALVDFRICVEADCRRAEERRAGLHVELSDLEHRIVELRQSVLEMESHRSRMHSSPRPPSGPAQRVA
jgi:chromosome segregation ATPase